MKAFEVPSGLAKWNARIAPILAKPFPPPSEPERREIPLWENISTCQLICEEVLDTEPSPGLLTQFYHELHRRGLSDAEIQELRHFAWLTAGWLNYEKCMWEWVNLDESDIQMAIDWQLKDGLIDGETAQQMRQFLADMLKKAEPKLGANQAPR